MELIRQQPGQRHNADLTASVRLDTKGDVYQRQTADHVALPHSRRETTTYPYDPLFEKLTSLAISGTFSRTSQIKIAISSLSVSGRGHFFGAAAEAMRRILIDRARDKNRLKRAGTQRPIDLDSNEIAMETPAEEILAFDESLSELASQFPENAELVKLRFSVGGTTCAHGYCHMNQVHVPVTGGLVVYPGDLLHGDLNGVTNIPHEIANEVPDACKELMAAEDIVLSYLKTNDPTPQGFVEARKACGDQFQKLVKRLRGDG